MDRTRRRGEEAALAPTVDEDEILTSGYGNGEKNK